jgi:hypothetical protein
LLGRAVVNVMNVELNEAWGWLRAMDIILVCFCFFDFVILWRVMSPKGLKNEKFTFWSLCGLLVLNTLWAISEKAYPEEEIYDFNINLNYLALGAGFIFLYSQKKHFLIFLNKIKEIAKNDHEKFGKNTHTKERWPYYLGISLVIVLNLIIYSYLLVRCTGSYIDEYMHIYSGISFFETGHFAEFIKGEYYSRGSLMSLLVGLLLLFHKSIFVAKLAPIIIGFLNLFLLIYLSRKILGWKFSLLFLTLYSIIPWVIFEHYYIRFYVIIELFFLLAFFIFFKIYKNLKLNNKKGLFIYISLLLLINSIFYFSQSDISRYILLYMSTVFGILIFLNFFQKIRKVLKRKIVIFFLLFSVSIFIIYLIKEYKTIIAIFTIEPAIGHFDIYNIFFSQYLFLTVLFLLSLLFIILSHNRIKIILFFTFLSVFIPLIFIFKNLQTLRGTVFLMPLFLLFSLYPPYLFSKIYKNLYIKIGFIIFLFLTIINSYPRDFINTPNIPSEVGYQDYYQIHKYLKNNINNQIIISSVPHVSEFYGVKVDYMLADNKDAFLDNERVKYYDSNEQIIKYTITKTKIILTYDDFLNILATNNGKKIFFIADDNLYKKSVSAKSKNLIENIFLVDTATVSYKNMKLYILEPHNLF